VKQLEKDCLSWLLGMSGQCQGMVEGSGKCQNRLEVRGKGIELEAVGWGWGTCTHRTLCTQRRSTALTKSNPAHSDPVGYTPTAATNEGNPHKEGPTHARQRMLDVQNMTPASA
jgi:hypothetical protein